MVLPSELSDIDKEAYLDKLRIGVQTRWRALQGGYLRQNRKRKQDIELNPFDAAVAKTREHVVSCKQFENEARSCLKNTTNMS